MKNVLMVLAVLAVAAPALAGDGQVSHSDLAAVGLGQLSVMSDAQGLQVRGMSASAESSGASVMVGQLFYSDNFGTNFLLLTDANQARGTAENGGLQIDTNADHTQGSAIAGGLAVDSLGNNLFTGTFQGFGGFAASPFSGIGDAFGR